MEIKQLQQHRCSTIREKHTYKMLGQISEEHGVQEMDSLTS